MTVADGFVRRFRSQVGWYLAVGAIGFAADALAYLFFAHVIGWPVVASRLAAFVPATLITWAINRRWTFARAPGEADRPVQQYLRYLSVQGAGIVVSFVTFQIVLSALPGRDFVALAAGSAVALLLNFAGSRWLVFTGKQGDPSLLVVAAFGAVSMVLGQDTNWDLYNYHLYNAWAFLTGRLHTDLAPAGMQTYFNPLIELPYYWMAMNLPAPAVAFIMGAAHGITLLLVASIVRRVRPQASTREVWLLALAGCTGAAFLAGFATTMGDNTTALLVLGAFVLCLRGLGSDRVAIFVVAGLMVGAATGLKLTNAVYAVGLAAALLVTGMPWRWRLRSVTALTAGGIAGIALTAGFWFWMMWQQFGNPLFPQFNSIFGSPMASPMGMGDPRWGPKTAFEWVAYPFVFIHNPFRIGEMPLRQLLWPAVYVAFIAWGAVTLVRRDKPILADGSRMVFAYVSVSYLLWLAIFGIGRYTVAMEVLLPLMLWLLLEQIWPDRAWARRAGIAVIAVAVLTSVIPFRTWGHASFAERSFRVPDLGLADPSRDTLMLIAQPVAWMAVHLPPELAFVSMFNFPESPAYIRRAEEIFKARGGQVWAVLPAATDTTARNVGRFNEWAGRQNFAADGTACLGVKAALKLSSRYRAYKQRPGGLCQFDPPANEVRRDLDAEDLATAQLWATHLRTRSYELDIASCKRLTAYMGQSPQAFRLCRVKR
ncbi:GtrA family protein [Caenimonas sp. SL110]|uniref:GtrA family protein n=1 Tax=Caenimonas sp. SL110 TaxID=1450524 RepID=UPI0009E3D5C8|nr:GtrA family protein [Caenimonas sp. SL110]